MKKLLLTIAALMLAATSVFAQYPDGYLSEDEMPEPYSWIPDPPLMTSAEFMNDFYHYQWGLHQRTVEGVSDIAIFDESAELEDVFLITINGTIINNENTPEIMMLVQRAVSDAHAANRTIKNHYQRIRPFATFKDESLIPETDEEEAATFSYPSGHSTRGYIYAMTLSTLMPQKTNDLMDRACVYALNRVICGHHWKSDIDASLLLAAGLFANIVSTEAFQEQLKKAREEYSRLTSGGTRIEMTEVAPVRGAAIYDMQGRQLNAKPNHGVYIQNGQKHIEK